MPDEFGGIPVETAPKTDEFGGIAVPTEQPLTKSDIPVARSFYEPVLEAFGQGFREGFGPDRMGLPAEDVKALSKLGIFAPEGATSYSNPLHAANELLLDTIWRAGEIAVRGGTGVFRGLQAAGVEAGLPRDVVALPEAFLGSPHPMGIPKTLPEVPVAEGAEVTRPTPEMQTAAGGPAERPLPQAQNDLIQARELGVIGPEPLPVKEQLAERAKTMAARQRDETVQGPQPSADPWRERFEKFVGKLETGEQVKDLILKSADENGEFNAARQGDIPLSQIGQLSEVTGVAPEELQLNQRGIGRLLKNDGEVRSAMQLMIKAGEDVQDAMREVAAKGGQNDFAELTKLQETIMRRDLAVEQIVGLRAEWGRTGNVFQEFQESVKDAQSLGRWLKDKKGRGVDDLRDLANAGRELNDPEKLQRFLHDQREPTFQDMARFYWINALISGPITHAKYVLANSAYAAYEGSVVTPLAAMIGETRRMVGLAGDDRVLHGEAAARMYGLVRAVPEAFKAAVSAAKTGMQTPLPGELAQNIIPRQNKNIMFQQTPIPGTIGKILGAPSRGASAIHSFFNFLGYRASVHQQAYAAAVKEGLSPSDAFWKRSHQIADRPTPEMMNKGIEEGYRLTFINDLNPALKSVQQALNKIPGAWMIMPFVHIPFQILSRATESTVLAGMSKAVREDLRGTNGARAQDMAAARIIAGSAFGAWMITKVLNDDATGYGPSDPKERALWMLTHQPYSLRIGDEWVSYNRFGPIGTLLGLHANVAEASPHFKWDGEEMVTAASMLVHDTGRLMEDEVGMQGLASVMELIDDPKRYGPRVIPNFVGSWMPFSSLQRQTASVMDPHMRETKTFIDGLKYQVPKLRESLYPKRDWTGSPVENPGYHSLLRTGTVNTDPVDLELQRLNIKPTPPENRISGVQLTPKLYDEYQSTAGPITRQTLESMVRQPNWQEIPAYLREGLIRSTIKSTRATGTAIMQVRHSEIIMQGLQDRKDEINGVKPKKKLVEQ
jgi:hypothetical protein